MSLKEVILVEVDDSDRSISETDVTFDYEPEVNFPLPHIRDLYLSDKNCLICGSNFNVPGLSNTVKKVCKFCFRGVCAKDLRFEYYHPEAKKIEKMCPNCYHTLIVMSEEFSNKLKAARLERIQLKQEIEFATKEKLHLIEERKVCETELFAIKSSNQWSIDEKNKVIDELQNIGRDLENKFAECNAQNEDVEMELVLAKGRYQNLQKTIEDLKEKNKKDLEISNKIKNELTEIQVKRIELMKTEDREVRNSENLDVIYNLNDEIHELQEKLEEKLGLNRDLEEIMEEHKKEIERRSVTISKLRVSIGVIRSGSQVNENMSPEELKKIEELKSQVNRLNEIIDTLKSRLALIVSKPQKQPDKDSSSIVVTISDKNQAGVTKIPNNEDRLGSDRCHSCYLL